MLTSKFWGAGGGRLLLGGGIPVPPPPPYETLMGVYVYTGSVHLVVLQKDWKLATNELLSIKKNVIPLPLCMKP